MTDQETITTQQISAPFLRMLRIFGCHPKDKSILGTIIFWIFAITGVIYSISSFIKCIQQTSLEIFAMTFIDFVVATQTTTKAISIYVNQKRFEKLLEAFWYDFWPVDKMPKFTKQHNQMHRIVMRGNKTYRAILFLCITQISFNALLAPTRTLAYNLYFFGYENNVLLTTPYYQITYFIEVITLSVSYTLCLIGYDMIYIAMCGCTITQFDMLKHKLLEIGEDEDDEQKSYDILKEAVVHHNMLLQFVKDLDKLVTLPILKQYLDAISCMGIYIYLTQQKFHFLHVFSLMTNLSQTLFFSSFGQLIQNRSLEVGDAAYDSKWHLLHSKRVRQALILVIQRSQKRNKISAGGFIFLSFESFVGMLKAAGSLIAVLRSTKE